MAIVRKTTSLRDQARAVAIYFALTAALQVALYVAALTLPLGVAGVSVWAPLVPAMFLGYTPVEFGGAVVVVVLVLGPGIAFLLARWGTRPAIAGLLAAVVTEVCASVLVFVGFEFFGARI